MSASRSFTLRLLDGRHEQCVEGVISLVAEDATGQFGLWSGHEPLLTVLEPGLFRYRQVESCGVSPWRFGAGAGGVLCTWPEPAEVRLVSSRFLLGEDPQALLQQLDAALAREHLQRVSTRDSQDRVDTALLRKLQELSQNPV
jgi:F-type H+-transporting ATPase subunit epsilon